MSTYPQTSLLDQAAAPASSSTNTPQAALYDPTPNAIVAQGKSLITLPISATGTAYDNTTSGLVSTTVQGAIDEVALGATGVPPILDSSTSNQNNLAPTGLQHGSVLLLQGAGSCGFTGLQALAAESVVTVVNDTTDYAKWLTNGDSNSLAANRFSLPDSFPAFMMPGDSIVLRYSARLANWMVISWTERGQAMGLNEFCDGFGSTGPFTATVSGTGAAAISSTAGVSSPEYAMGVAGVALGTTTTGRAFIGAANDQAIVPGRGCLLGISRVSFTAASSGTETYALYFGFHDFQTGTLTDGIAWEYRWNGSAVELNALVAKATVVARSTTGAPAVPAAAEFIWFVVFVNADCSRADFIYSTDSVSFTKATSVSSGLPGATDYIGFAFGGIKSLGTTSRNLVYDLMGYRANYGVRG